jgi:Fe-S-cluster containining protein
MGEAKRRKAQRGGSIDDPTFRKAIFTQAFEQTCKLLDDPKADDLRALILTYRGRNGSLDKTAATYAAGKAECQIGCASCCHQMVLCTPFEVFAIARYLLETKTAAEVGDIKGRLGRLAALPLDPNVRYGVQNPCALLVNDRCTVYEQRPSVCRTMLSASRKACETCLASNGVGAIPYLADPAAIAAMMQLGIDYALIARRNLFVEGVELSGALLIALNDFDGTITIWANRGNPFAGCEVRRSGDPSRREMAEMAAKRFEVA